jgi:hypothetical protein
MPSQFADDEIINRFVEYIKIKLIFSQNEGVNYFNILLIWSTNNAVRLAAARWFSSGTPVSSTNKADRHDITEILLKVALNTITLSYHHKV